MAENKYEFLVLGGGSAGYAAARTYAESGAKVAVVDGADELAGLCILRGCMPSKTLIYSSEVLEKAHQAKELGLEIPSAKVDMPALRDRKRNIIKGFQEYRVEQLISNRFDLFRSCGSFVDAHTVKLDSGDTITFEKAIITTGSVSQVPPLPGLAEINAWTSDDVLELDFVPEKVIVLGAGVVGCELGQHLRRLGSEVTIIQRSPQILKQASPEGAKVLAEVFRRQGIDVRCHTAVTRVEGTMGESCRVFFDCDGKKDCVVEAPYIFNALGRRPAIDGLNLDGIGVSTKRSGSIVINEYQQTSLPHLYAAGDVSGPHEIVHIAIMQGEVAARHALGRPVEPVNYDLMIGGFFTDPEVARVGPYEHEAREQGLDVVCADYPFDDHGRSITMNQTDGFVKVVALRENGRVIGAECVGPSACELIHAMAVAVTTGATVFDLLKVHWYHPTLAEIWSYPIEEIADALTEGE